MPASPIRHRLWIALQMAVVALSLLVLLVPAARTVPVKAAAGLLILLFQGLYLLQAHRQGALKLTPRQLFNGFREGRLKPAAPLEVLASVLGAVALVVAL